MADDSDSSSLSSAPEEEVKKLAPIFQKAKLARSYVPKSPPRKPQRPPSPPHEEVLADNADIALLVMFRARFDEVMPGKLAHFGPQDIERGVVDTYPSPQVEALLCALLGLVLNRKKPVERGHHSRALEEAMLSQKSQWPSSWEGHNPLHGGKDFNNMTPAERLNLLRTLAIWSLSTSDALQNMIKERYKQQRHNDDENQPLSVQPWGVDGDKRRYFLVQGLDDTSFRVYREGNRYTKNAHWWNVAGTIDEMKELATKLETVDGSQAARRLAGKITNAVPTFEASEEKRKRREYRQIRRAAFSRPEPGYSLYEGRTRGKRMRYTYDDDDDSFLSDSTSARRSTRQSGRNTPMETGPTYTASGRQVRQPRNGGYGESHLGGEHAISNGGPSADFGEDDEDEPIRPSGRATRAAGRSAGVPGSNKRGYNSIDDMSDEDAAPSGDDWNSDNNEVEDDDMPDADDEDENDEDSAQEDDEDEGDESLVVTLKVQPKALQNGHAKPPPNNHDSSEEVKPALDTAHTADVSMTAAADTDHVPAPVTENGAEQPKQNGTAHAAPLPAAVSQSTAATPPAASMAYPTPASGSFASEEVKPSVSAFIGADVKDGPLPQHHSNGLAAEVRP